MSPPSGAAVATRFRYHDGTSRTVYATATEIPFLDGRLIVSRANLNGIITHANDAFVEMSGYTRAELIGAPHHILRHPDMPKKAFGDLWEALQIRKKWHGYIKNLRKDGAYYWVYATAIPNIRNGVVVGYTSVRRKPSRTRIAEIEPIYQQWLQQEATP